MQKLVLEQDAKRYVPLQSSHFFHLDSHDSKLLIIHRILCLHNAYIIIDHELHAIPLQITCIPLL